MALCLHKTIFDAYKLNNVKSPIQANSGQVWGYSFIGYFGCPKKEVTKRYHHWAINGTMLYSGIAAPTIGSGQPDALLAYAHTHIYIRGASVFRTDPSRLPMRIHIYTYSYAISALSTATPFLYNSSGAISISPFCQTVTP